MKQPPQSIKQLLYLCATHPDANIYYKEIDTVLRFRSDGLYLSESQAHSRSGGDYF